MAADKQHDDARKHLLERKGLAFPSCIGPPNFTCRHRQLKNFETDRASADHAAHRRHVVRDHEVPSSGEVYQVSKGRQRQRHFVLSDWWRCNSGELPHFAFVLRAVLTNAPNSCPPERLFSMFNATFGEDQKRSFGDYLELAMQVQYNKRNV